MALPFAPAAPTAAGAPTPPQSTLTEYLVAAGVAAVGISVVELVYPPAAVPLAGLILAGVAFKLGAVPELASILTTLQTNLPGLHPQAPGPTDPTGEISPPPPGPPGPVAPSGHAFPVAGGGQFSNTHWDGSQAVDIFAPLGTAVRAVVSGTVRAATYSLGGNTATLSGVDGRTYYYAHLQGPARSGPVQAGDTIGGVGQSGNAAGKPPHLHFAFGNGPNAIDSNGAGNLPPWDWLRALLRSNP